ncbi:MAG: Crp/Fnr family transcriptional regulator [Rhodospirillaceae bacterium]
MTFVKPARETIPARANLREHGWFAGLPAADLTRLEARCGRFAFAAGRVLFHQGDEMTHCLFLERGAVNVFRHTRSGEEKVFGQFSAGQFVAVTATFMRHGRFPMTARAQSEGRALVLPRATLQGFCREHPDLAMRLLTHFSENLNATLDRVDWLTSSTASERVAEDLLRLARQQGGPRLELPLSRAEWAATLGIRSETLSRLLSSWRRQGAISCRGQSVEMLDLAFLQRIAGAERC